MPDDAKRKCLDAALKLLKSRAHSTAELRRKLRRKFDAEMIAATVEKLTRVGYLNDEAFAKAKASSAARLKQHGRRRAKLDLIKAGVQFEVADRALDSVYAETDTLAVARDFAKRQANRLRKLDPQVARRRLVAALQRRGFDYDDIKPVVEDVLGRDAADD